MSQTIKENNIIVAYGSKIITLSPDSTEFNLIKQILKFDDKSLKSLKINQPRYAVKQNLMQVTASSIHAGTHNFYKLDNQMSHGAWCSQQAKLNEFIQVYSNEPKKIVGIVLQGRFVCDQWVQKYKLSYSNDGQQFFSLFDSRQFNGNSDRNTKIYHYFQTPIIVKALRINPTQWHSHISLRFDVLIQ